MRGSLIHVFCTGFLRGLPGLIEKDHQHHHSISRSDLPSIAPIPNVPSRSALQRHRCHLCGGTGRWAGFETREKSVLPRWRSMPLTSLKTPFCRGVWHRCDHRRSSPPGRDPAAGTPPRSTAGWTPHPPIASFHDGNAVGRRVLGDVSNTQRDVRKPRVGVSARRDPMLGAICGSLGRSTEIHR